MAEPGDTPWERVGAASGVLAALLLGAAYWMTTGRAEALLDDPAGAAAELRDASTLWEWNTLLRLAGGLMLVWSAGSVAGRLRAWEGEPGRLAGIVHATAVLWGAVWLASALFNSVAIGAADGVESTAHVAFTLAHEAVAVLSPSIAFTMLLATSFAVLRFGGYPAWHGYATAALATVVLGTALADWYGAGTLSAAIVTVALAWFAVTAGLTVGPYGAPDPVLGARAGAVD